MGRVFWFSAQSEHGRGTLSTVPTPDSLEGLQGRLEYMTQRVEAMVTTDESQLSAKMTHIGQGTITAAIVLPPAVVETVVTWPGSGFPSEVYDVEIVPLALLGRGNMYVVAQDATSVTVRLDATLTVSAGTTFLVFGRC